MYVIENNIELRIGLNIGKKIYMCVGLDDMFFTIGSRHELYNPFIRPVILSYNSTLHDKSYLDTLFGEKNQVNSDTIIIGEKYYLDDIKTIKKFGFRITADYISLICSLGNIKTLDYLEKNNMIHEHNAGALWNASLNGHVHVLEWWKNSGLPLEYNAELMNIASGNGYVNLLEWWLKSGLELKYHQCALNDASSNGHINVLDWWLKSGLKLEYDKEILYKVSIAGNIDVLDWWFKSNLPLKYSEKILKHQHLLNASVIELLKNHNYF